MVQFSKATILVETALGRDYVMSAIDTGSMKVVSAAGEKHVSGRFAVVSVQNDGIAWTFVQDK